MWRHCRWHYRIIIFAINLIAVAAAAAQRKIDKHIDLSGHCLIFFIANVIETINPVIMDGLGFIWNLCHRIFYYYLQHAESISFPYRRTSVAVQRFNAVPRSATNLTMANKQLYFVHLTDIAADHSICDVRARWASRLVSKNAANGYWLYQMTCRGCRGWSMQ